MDYPVIAIGMNQICFNDLSSYPLCADETEIEVRMNQYIQTLQGAGLNGIKKVRYADDLTSVLLREGYSVQDGRGSARSFYGHKATSSRRE